MIVCLRAASGCTHSSQTRPRQPRCTCRRASSPILLPAAIHHSRYISRIRKVPTHKESVRNCRMVPLRQQSSSEHVFTAGEWSHRELHQQDQQVQIKEFPGTSQKMQWMWENVQIAWHRLVVTPSGHWHKNSLEWLRVHVSLWARRHRWLSWHPIWELPVVHLQPIAGPTPFLC